MYRAGGSIEGKRVSGLGMARAFGDFQLKNDTSESQLGQIITAEPEVLEWKLDPKEDEFAVFACDGIWDVHTNQEVVDFVRKNIVDGIDYGQTCEELMDWCLAPNSNAAVGIDNMTVIIVGFLFGKEHNDLVRRCKRKPTPKSIASNAASKDETSPKENSKRARNK